MNVSRLGERLCDILRNCLELFGIVWNCLELSVFNEIQ